ncbi:MAG: enoyl-CoA hydratase/isomerase family protein [Alphaproteobacteria bacterium]|nr:enoyl-CoA hydratase/isomerase family protein [Alphaproteobacteria bacterium]
MNAEGPSPTSRIIAAIEDAVGWIVFNNPAKRNAVSLDMWRAIPAILDRFERDDAVRVVALKGAGGKAFLSGADISEFEKVRATPEQVETYNRIAETAVARLNDCPKPTVAVIEGFCMGGGVGVALACDLRFASAGSTFAIPAARLGLSYRWSDLKKLVDLVGPAAAKEIFFTARSFTAAEAERMGLINRYLPDGELEAFARDTCARIAENAPLTIAATKGVVAELSKPAHAIDKAHCEALVKACYASADYAEGRRAFMEKRKPRFKGK